ncbi:Glycosyltransferase [Archaeoglobus sulfaticallidus PM70-1]|uniref:Glycosyltransferase n=1 Tax=Archaeoglobus sulfaticallidus PM70-1 TaxID=387631 RepID=N0BKT6_9EURY|nr:glycosyltransferase family 4 protein [Archaeoglobus sulfaticallidus]AGK60825.1 Glycosyltransferase [Archaeoglobus sulfaticallidus PM70-1]
MKECCEIKIALTTPYYPPHIGGVEIHVEGLVRQLSKKYNVTVISSNNTRCIEIPYSPIPVSFPGVQADIYHSHVPSPFFAWWVMKKGYSPHVITYHNDVVVPSTVNGYRIPGNVGYLVERVNEKVIVPVLESCDVIIATTKSYAVTSPVLSRFIDKVEVVPNAVDLKKFNCKNVKKQDFVLYVGRLVEYKGLPVLIEAMKKVQKEFDCELIVIGDGEDRARLENLAKNIKARFLGRLPTKEVIGWMQKARVLVLPSFSRLEAFGIVLLEAMACGTPVIASNIAGVREVALEGGLVFDDVDDLSNKILKILTNDSFAKKLSAKGLKSVKNYSWEVVSEKIEKIYLRLV